MKKLFIVVFACLLMFCDCADKTYCYSCTISKYWEPQEYIYTYPKTIDEGIQYCDVTEDDIEIIKKQNTYIYNTTLGNVKTKVTSKMTCKQK